MSYKILKVTTFYNNFLKYYYHNNQEIKKEKYAIQYRHLMDQCFAYSDFFSKNFRKIGIESYDIILNATPLQDAWWKEFGKEYTSDIFIEQLKYYKPEVLIVQDTLWFDIKYINYIRNEIKSIKLIIGFCCFPIPKEHLKIFKVYDFILACSPQFVHILKQNNIKTYEFNHSFEESIIQKLRPIEKDSNKLIFTGSFISSSSYHDDRLKLVEFLLQSGIDLDIYTSAKNEAFSYYLSKYTAYYFANILKKIGLDKINQRIKPLKKVRVLDSSPKKAKYSKVFIKKTQPPVYGIEMYRKLKQANMVLNVHGGIAGDYAANVRLFEATGIGSCLITDYKKNIKSFFDPGYEIVTYENPDECIEKIHWLQNNPEAANDIAIAGQKRTLRNHTIQNRVLYLNNIIKENLKNV